MSAQADREGTTRGGVIGYARVSTAGQDPSLQMHELERAGAVRIFVDVASGSSSTPGDRPQLAAALDYARPGDVLTVWRLDRLGRSLRDLIEQIRGLEDRGIGFRSITESIDTTTAGGRLIFHVFGALAEFERQLIRERTIAGLEAARADGRTGGRPTVMTPDRTKEAARMRAEGMALDKIARLLGVGRSSVTRALSRVDLVTTGVTLQQRSSRVDLVFPDPETHQELTRLMGEQEPPPASV